MHGRGSHAGVADVHAGTEGGVGQVRRHDGREVQALGWWMWPYASSSSILLLLLCLARQRVAAGKLFEPAVNSGRRRDAVEEGGVAHRPLALARSLSCDTKVTFEKSCQGGSQGISSG